MHFRSKIFIFYSEIINNTNPKLIFVGGLKLEIKKIFFITVSIIFFSTSAFAGELIKLTTGEYYPFMAENLKYKGIASRIVTEAFKLCGYEVSIKTLPWKRAYAEAKIGKNYQGTYVWFKNSDREKDFYFSDPVVEERQFFFHLKSYPFTWSTIDDLKNVNIGGIFGFSYGKKFDDAVKSGKIHVERTTESIQCLKMLHKGNIQIFPQVLEVGYGTIEKNFSHKVALLFTHHPESLYTNFSYLMLSKNDKKNKNLIEKFNKSLQKLKEKGIFKNYYEDFLKGKYQRIGVKP